jgi:hypothetical protein
MFHGKNRLTRIAFELLHITLFHVPAESTSHELWAFWKWPWPLHITPPNLFFHGRIGITRAIGITLEIGSIAESYILSRVHILFSIQLRFLDCWKIMRKDQSPSNWSFGTSRYKFQWKFKGTSLLENNAHICCCVSNGLTNKIHLNNEL